MLGFKALNADDALESHEIEQKESKERQETELRRQYQRGIRLQAEERPEDARVEYQAVLAAPLVQQLPDDPALCRLRYSAHKNLAAVLRTLGQGQEALQAYTAALDLDPRDTLVWHAFGLLALDLSQVSLARHAFERALQQNPRHLLSLRGLIDTLYLLCDLPSLAPCLLRGLHLLPGWRHVLAVQQQVAADVAHPAACAPACAGAPDSLQQLVARRDRLWSSRQSVPLPPSLPSLTQVIHVARPRWSSLLSALFQRVSECQAAGVSLLMPVIVETESDASRRAHSCIGCGRGEDGIMISCDACNVWHHADCVNLNPDNMPDEFVCPKCAGADVPLSSSATTAALTGTQDSVMSSSALQANEESRDPTASQPVPESPRRRRRRTFDAPTRSSKRHRGGDANTASSADPDAAGDRAGDKAAGNGTSSQSGAAPVAVLPVATAQRRSASRALEYYLGLAAGVNASSLGTRKRKSLARKRRKDSSDEQAEVQRVMAQFLAPTKLSNVLRATRDALFSRQCMPLLCSVELDALRLLDLVPTQAGRDSVATRAYVAIAAAELAAVPRRRAHSSARQIDRGLLRASLGQVAELLAQHEDGIPQDVAVRFHVLQSVLTREDIGKETVTSIAHLETAASLLKHVSGPVSTAVACDAVSLASVHERLSDHQFRSVAHKVTAAVADANHEHTIALLAPHLIPGVLQGDDDAAIPHAVAEDRMPAQERFDYAVTLFTALLSRPASRTHYAARLATLAAALAAANAATRAGVRLRWSRLQLLLQGAVPWLMQHQPAVVSADRRVLDAAQHDLSVVLVALDAESSKATRVKTLAWALLVHLRVLARITEVPQQLRSLENTKLEQRLAIPRSIAPASFYVPPMQRRDLVWLVWLHAHVGARAASDGSNCRACEDTTLPLPLLHVILVVFADALRRETVAAEAATEATSVPSSPAADAQHHDGTAEPPAKRARQETTRTHRSGTPISSPRSHSGDGDDDGDGDGDAPGIVAEDALPEPDLLLHLAQCLYCLYGVQVPRFIDALAKHGTPPAKVTLPSADIAVFVFHVLRGDIDDTLDSGRAAARDALVAAFKAVVVHFPDPPGFSFSRTPHLPGVPTRQMVQVYDGVYYTLGLLLSNMVRVVHDAKDIDTAVHHLVRALYLERDQVALWQALGQACLAQVTDALHAVEQGIDSVMPSNAVAALAAAGISRYFAARDALLRALRLDPSDAEPALELGLAALRAMHLQQHLRVAPSPAQRQSVLLTAQCALHHATVELDEDAEILYSLGKLKWKLNAPHAETLRVFAAAVRCRDRDDYHPLYRLHTIRWRILTALADRVAAAPDPTAALAQAQDTLTLLQQYATTEVGPLPAKRRAPRAPGTSSAPTSATTSQQPQRRMSRRSSARGDSDGNDNDGDGDTAAAATAAGEAKAEDGSECGDEMEGLPGDGDGGVNDNDSGIGDVMDVEGVLDVEGYFPSASLTVAGADNGTDTTQQEAKVSAAPVAAGADASAAPTDVTNNSNNNTNANTNTNTNNADTSTIIINTNDVAKLSDAVPVTPVLAQRGADSATVPPAPTGATPPAQTTAADSAPKQAAGVLGAQGQAVARDIAEALQELGKKVYGHRAKYALAQMYLDSRGLFADADTDRARKLVNAFFYSSAKSSTHVCKFWRDQRFETEERFYRARRKYLRGWLAMARHSPADFSMVRGLYLRLTREPDLPNVLTLFCARWLITHLLDELAVQEARSPTTDQALVDRSQVFGVPLPDLRRLSWDMWCDVVALVRDNDPVVTAADRLIRLLHSSTDPAAALAEVLAACQKRWPSTRRPVLHRLRQVRKRRQHGHGDVTG